MCYTYGMQIVLTADILLAAYTQGLFPMAETADSQRVLWFCPEMRGQISIPDMHVPKRLKKTVRHMRLKSGPYEIFVNRDFEAVIAECAKETFDRPDTWINTQITKAYVDLHEKGHAHSVECWQEGKLVGGLYGVEIGGAFFGESMFSRQSDASKVCLVHLAARLHHAGFLVLDTQFKNDHLKQFGVY
ncbi:MAG: leucyl/phenylalanyl-tRNA--protein transferase [Alphaproteobacteria bacterium]|nr:leucyl/phenylalanyl-tRNA--protein transferase [Alphaproteobacteria bacterium]